MINIKKIYYAQFELSFFAIYRYLYNQNISFIEQSAWKKVSLLFNGATRRSTVCTCAVICAGISMSWDRSRFDRGRMRCVQCAQCQ